MATPMRSTDFRSIVEPILNKEFDGIYDQRADEWASVFKEFTGIPRNYHEEPVLYGFGSAPELPDGSPVTYQDGGVLFIDEVYQLSPKTDTTGRDILNLLLTFAEDKRSTASVILAGYRDEVDELIAYNPG